MYRNQSNIFVLSILLMFFSVSLSILLFIIFNGAYPIYFSIIVFPYLFAYFTILFFLDNYIRLKNIIIIFLILKGLIFLLSISNIEIGEHYLRFLSSDAGHYHIPSTLNLYHGDYLNYLFSSSFNFNGRLTHVILSILSDSHQLTEENFYNIALKAFCVNTIFNIFTILIIYRTAFIYYKSIALARKAAFFLAFNPFIIYYSMIAQKEALLFLALSLVVLFIVNNNKKLLVLSSIIFLFERPYMIILNVLFLFFLSKQSLYIKILLIVFAVILIEYFLGIERALSMHTHYLESLRETTKSLLPYNNFLGDVLKLIFSPAFIRPFMGNTIDDNIFYVLYYLTIPFYTYIIISSFLSLKQSKIILLSLGFVYFIAPFHGVLKLTILTIFMVFYIDKFHIKIKGINI